jgi:hypothetical protein
MVTQDQLASWMTKIREDPLEIIFKDTTKPLEVSPAEKIRYEENTRFGAAFLYAFHQIVKQDKHISRTRIEYLFDQSMKDLSQEQQLRARKVREYILHHYDTAPTKEEVVSSLPVTYPYLFRQPNRVATFLVPERDIEVTPLGAIVITIADEAIWDQEVIMSGHAIGKRCVELKGKNLPPMLERILLVRGDARVAKQKENTRVHELFHDLYGNVFQEMPHNIRYPDPGRTDVAGRIKDEIIAYLLNQDWHWQASGLTGYSRLLEQRLDINIAVSHAKKGVCDNYGFTDEQKAEPILNRFRVEIEAVCDELFRLQWAKAPAFDEALPKILAAQTLKEIAFHLHSIDGYVLRATELITRVDGKIVDSFVVAGFDYIRKHQLKLSDINELKQQLEEEKRLEDAKGHEKNILYSVILSGLIMRCP